MESCTLAEMKFRDFLAKLSDEFTGTKLQLLKFLLFDHLPISRLSYKQQTGIYLFNELNANGHISYNNIQLLSEIVELVNSCSAKKQIEKYKAVNEIKSSTVDTKLKTFRKRLYRALVEVSDDDLINLIGNYDLDHLGFNNIWDLVFYLEKEKLLDDTKEKIKTFAGRLNKVAADILLGISPELPKSKKEQSFNMKPKTTKRRTPLPVVETKKKKLKLNNLGTPAAGESKKHRKLPGRSASSTRTSKLLSSRNSSKTTTLPPSTETSPTSEALTGPIDRDLQIMLDQVSNWYDEKGLLNTLKLLYKDIVPYNDLQSCNKTMELFELLKRNRHLQLRDFKILIQTVQITDTRGVLTKSKLLQEEYNRANGEITLFSVYRQNLIKFGQTISTSDVKRLGDLYEVSRKKYDDQWTLIMELEKEILRESKIHEFIKVLKSINLHHMAEILEN